MKNFAYLMSYAFYNQNQDRVHSAPFCSTDFEDLLLRVVEHFSIYCGTDFEVVKVGDPADNGYYQFDLMHPTWKSTYRLSHMPPRNQMERYDTGIPRLLQHIVENTVVNGEVIKSQWEVSGLVADYSRHFDVVEELVMLPN